MPDLSTDHSQASLDGAHSHGRAAAPQGRYVASRADRPTSFDPADIPVPRGREEEWRFTPMKRFRPLFGLEAVRAGSATDSVTVAVDAPQGVDVESLERTDERLGPSAPRWTAPASSPGWRSRPPPPSPSRLAPSSSAPCA